MLGPGLVFLSNNVAPGAGWVIRTFDNRGEYSNENPDLQLEEIIRGADYSEFPPAYSVKNYDGWALYLKLRTKAVEDFERLSAGNTVGQQIQQQLVSTQDPYESNETS